MTHHYTLSPFLLALYYNTLIVILRFSSFEIPSILLMDIDLTSQSDNPHRLIHYTLVVDTVKLLCGFQCQRLTRAVFLRKFAFNENVAPAVHIVIYVRRVFFLAGESSMLLKPVNM